MVLSSPLVPVLRAPAPDSSSGSTSVPGAGALRVGSAQINTVTGDIASNTKKIVQTLEFAATAGADLVVFPELTLTGYPPRDLLLLPAFVEENLRALAEVAHHCQRVAALVGHVERNPSGEGKPLFNSVSLCQRGVARTVCRKTLLPTYDVFDEARWFQPSATQEPLRFGRRLLGVSICEDIWNSAFHHGRRLYDVDPTERLVAGGAEILINVSASPHCHGRRAAKCEMFAQTARQHGRPLLQVNLVGGNDSLIFDGGSSLHSAAGELLHQAPFFEEHFDLLNFDALPSPIPTPEETIADLHRALVLGVRDYLRKCGFKSAVVGLSGGIDSAVTAALAVEALGADQVLGITMPTMFSSEGSVTDSQRLAENLGIECQTVPVQAVVEAFEDKLRPLLGEGELGVTGENIQARVRGVILMAVSNRTGALLLTTGNKSELAVGYCTLYGDMAGGLAVISDVPKTMVYELARHINRHEEIIPEAILEKPPSAELAPDQRDSDSLPPYDLLDPIMRAHVEEHLDASAIVARGFDEKTVRRVLHLIAASEYKRRQAPPGLRVTSRAFGDGWRIPMARGKLNL